MTAARGAKPRATEATALLDGGAGSGGSKARPPPHAWAWLAQPAMVLGIIVFGVFNTLTFKAMLNAYRARDSSHDYEPFVRLSDPEPENAQPRISLPNPGTPT